MLYVNNSKFSLSEELEFNLQNCHIDGAYGSFIEIVVEPGKERLLRIDVDDQNKDFTAWIKKLYYKVFWSIIIYIIFLILNFYFFLNNFKWMI